jgi:hypothetical protein
MAGTNGGVLVGQLSVATYCSCFHVYVCVSCRAMLPRLPEALMRVAPSWGPAGPFTTRSGNTSSSQAQQDTQGLNMPALAALRQQMGLLHGAAAPAGGGQGSHAVKAPTHILQVRGPMVAPMCSDACVSATGHAQSRCIRIRTALQVCSNHLAVWVMYVQKQYQLCATLSITPLRSFAAAVRARRS